MSTRTFTVSGGIDVGNGYVKASLGEDRSIDLPSSITTMVGPNPLPLDDDRALAWAKGDVYNDLDLSFDSPQIIPDRYRKLFGRGGMSADGILGEFQITGGMTGRDSKSDSPLSYEFIIGILAGWGLRQAILANGGLPDGEVTVHAVIGLALPISEYMRRRKPFAAALQNGPHMVTSHTFATPVVVRVDITDAQVIAEGASAQLAIIKRGEPLMEAMLADVRRHGMKLEGITAADVLAAGDFVGVDIGEGTVNFPVFTGHAFNGEASATLAQGYGTVLHKALEDMDAAQVHTGFRTRKQLSEFLAHEPSPLKRGLYDTVRAFVDRQTGFFADAVAARFSQLMAVVGAMNEVAYVYGGGSGPMKDVLYPKLLDIAGGGESDGFPVLYLDASYSRNLNREGLVIAAEASTHRRAGARPR